MQGRCRQDGRCLRTHTLLKKFYTATRAPTNFHTQ